MKIKIKNNLNISVHNDRDFNLQFYMLTDEVEVALAQVFIRYLERYGMLFLAEILLSVTKELINNGIKANLKRLYFKHNNLNIDKKQDYDIGMTNFKKSAYSTNNQLFKDLKNEGHYIKVNFINLDDCIKIRITNNVPILDEELLKVNFRIDAVYSNDDLAGIINSLVDDTESAGLGLAMALMICKNAGLSKDSFHVAREGNKTVCELKLPMAKMKPGKMILRNHINKGKGISQYINRMPSIQIKINTS